MRQTMKCCTNRFLEEGYKLTDNSGQTIAVLVDGEFKRWAAGSWSSKFDSVRRLAPAKISTYGRPSRLRGLEAARKAALLNRNTWRFVGRHSDQSRFCQL